jgi:hypothetical protein
MVRDNGRVRKVVKRQSDRYNCDLHTTITLEAGEYSRLLRLIGAYGRLASAVQDFTERYGSITPSSALRDAMDVVHLRRREYGQDLASRNGMSDD